MTTGSGIYSSSSSSATTSWAIREKQKRSTVMTPLSIMINEVDMAPSIVSAAHSRKTWLGPMPPPNAITAKMRKSTGRDRSNAAYVPLFSLTNEQTKHNLSQFLADNRGSYCRKTHSLSGATRLLAAMR